MDLRHWNVALGGVGPHDVGPEPRHRFRQKTAPATDVEDAQTGERFVVGQVAPELRRDL